MQHLVRTFADERGRLERHWDRGDDVPTDNLRDAFQRYRSFFERLLAIWSLQNGCNAGSAGGASRRERRYCRDAAGPAAGTSKQGR
jgi:hypothetical protein